MDILHDYVEVKDVTEEKRTPCSVLEKALSCIVAKCQREKASRKKHDAVMLAMVE